MRVPLLSLLILLVAAPAAAAQMPLPDARTHQDPAEPPVTSAGEVRTEAGPRLTLLRPDTDIRDVRRGYLFVKARCDKRCVVEVSASTRIAGKQREVATATKTLPARKVRRIKLRIRTDVRRRIAAGARFRFEALPFPPA